MNPSDKIRSRPVLQKLACLLCLALIGWYPGISQDSPNDFKECLFLQTDRDLYVVGEQVWLKVYKLDALENKPDNFSKVVYIELLNQDGFPVNQLKLHMPDKSGSAGFTLSDTLSSGNYLLRAYTSWMKNYPARDFSFRTISLINPFRGLEKIGVGSSIPVGKDGDPCRTTQPDNGIILSLENDSDSCGTRERIRMNIRAADLSGNPVDADLSVSVARSCWYVDHCSHNPELLPSPGKEEQEDPATYLPELEGIILDGTILNSQSDQPIRNEQIVMSIVGKAARCQVYRTTDNGKFYFNLDETGVQEIVIQPADSALRDFYVELESDYYIGYDHPFPGPFYLDTTRLQELNQGIINMQIQNIYKPYQQGKSSGAAEAIKYDFYGEAEFRIQISDYILLENIREVIKELIPKVSLQVKNGKSSLWIENGIDDRYFDHKPLVLVDGVPFDDVDQILNISIGDLEQIEVINLRYFLDGHMFEGIIHFLTNEGKMAGLEFDHAIFRQAYAAFSEEVRFRSPSYGSDSLRNSSIADFRNTLYWNPGLSTREDGETSFEFYTSDEPGEYTVYVEGITPGGKSGFICKKLFVH